MSFGLFIQFIRESTSKAEKPANNRVIEKTIEELVSITGLTASNIKVKLHRIRKKLFVLLNGMDHE